MQRNWDWFLVTAFAVFVPWPVGLSTCLGLALAATLGGTSPPLHAQTVFDATAEFSVTNGNPNGAWSYGWMPVDFSTFNLFTQVNTTGDEGGSPGWFGNLAADTTPCIRLHLGPETPEGVPTGWLFLHPGPGTEPSVLRWQAPSSASVEVKGQFLAGNWGIMKVAVLQGTNFLWQRADSGTFDLLTVVGAGQTIDFAVFGEYISGATPLAATITLVNPVRNPKPLTPQFMENAVVAGTSTVAPVLVFILVGIGVCLLLVLAILWLIFPWLVHSKMSALERNSQATAKTMETMLAALNALQATQVKIEENTRMMARQNLPPETTPPTQQ